MKHRLVHNGLGANAEVLLDNQGRINKEFANAALDFLKLEGLDFQVGEHYVSVGIEPTYMYQPLKIITISRNKDDSTYVTGTAWGPYGSGIAKRVRRRGNYKKKSKFTKFVDEWHPFLFVSR
jgi:hypothetical protein